MSGAYKLARDWVTRHVREGQSVLELGSGSGAISQEMLDAGARVFSVDSSSDRASVRKPDLVVDLVHVPWKWAKDNSVDVVVAMFCLHHLLGREASVWGEIGRVVKKGGLLVASGRHRLKVPHFEWDRAEPLKGDNRQTLIGLCAASGFQMRDFMTAFYTPEDNSEAPPEVSNAWALTAICTKGQKP
jgi:SAM-dependent methyltransferase